MLGYRLLCSNLYKLNISNCVILTVKFKVLISCDNYDMGWLISFNISA